MGKHINVEGVAMILQPGQMGVATFAAEEDDFASVAALRDVVGNDAENGPG